jgi:hypothetical protein
MTRARWRSPAAVMLMIVGGIVGGLDPYPLMYGVGWIVALGGFALFVL